VIPYHLFRHRMSIQRRTMAADAGGHQIPTWSTIASAVPCFVQPGDGDEPERGGGKQPSQKFRIYLAADVDVTSVDQILFDGRTLKIEGPGKNLVEFDRVARLDCVEQKP
jgi:head-tail adaptor